MTLFKALGLFLVFSACSLMGFYMGVGLKKRSGKLNSICISLSKLSRLVSLGVGELGELIKSSFEGEILSVENGKIMLNKSYLSSEDIKLFEELLKEMGISDRQSECERIDTYKTLFEKQLKIAEERDKQLFKLYNSLGVLIGLAVCIFVL